MWLSFLFCFFSLHSYGANLKIAAFTKLVIDWSGIGPISRTSLHIGQVQLGTLRERRLEGNCIRCGVRGGGGVQQKVWGKGRLGGCDNGDGGDDAEDDDYDGDEIDDNHEEEVGDDFNEEEVGGGDDDDVENEEEQKRW